MVFSNALIFASSSSDGLITIFQFGRKIECMFARIVAIETHPIFPVGPVAEARHASTTHFFCFGDLVARSCPGEPSDSMSACVRPTTPISTGTR